MLQYSQKILWTEILAFQLQKCFIKKGMGWDEGDLIGSLGAGGGGGEDRYLLASESTVHE